MKIYLKSLLLLVMLITSHSFAMNAIRSEHDQRLTKFSENRKDVKILSHTNNIYSVLNDESKISERPATDSERKTIFQSLMASAIIHGGIEETGQSSIPIFTHNVLDQTFVDHYKVIDLVGQISRGLVGHFKEAGYEGIKVSILSASFGALRNFSGVAMDLFMDWFYESLEQHYDEFSFFGGANVGAPSSSGKIDREWFYNVQNQFNAGNTNIQTCKNGAVEQTWVLNKEGVPFAIYKPSACGRVSLGHRKIITESMSGLFAKVMNIDDVVNRAIPVHVKAAVLTFDPSTPTGTIERFLGFSDSQIPKGAGGFLDLMRHVCTFNANKFKNEYESNRRLKQ